MLPNRSKSAFLMSVEELFAQAKAKKRTVYFWTFTWPTPQSFWCYRRSWDRFIHMLNARFTSDEFAALRVWEAHETHGLHVHMLCNERLGVQLIRRLALHCGLGRVVYVRRAVPKDAQYMAKYMVKGERIEGVRQWAKIGNWEHVKTGDLRFESLQADRYRAVYGMLTCGGMKHREAFVHASRYVAQLSRDNELDTFTGLPGETVARGMVQTAFNIPN